MSNSSKTKKWKNEQINLKKKLVLENCYNWSIDCKENGNPLRLVGGVDISFAGNQQKDACVALLVLSYPSLSVVYERYKMIQLSEPYIPGFLAFREVNFIVDLIEDLRKTDPKLLPQVIFVDGNGVLHSEGFGLASHLGVLVDIPTIGIGKNLFCVDGLTKQSVKTQALGKMQKAGDTMKLIGKSGKVWGVALRTSDSSKRYVFVSIGHRISLEAASNLVCLCSKYRIPEPIRMADLGSRDVIRKWRNAKPCPTSK